MFPTDTCTHKYIGSSESSMLQNQLQIISNETAHQSPSGAGPGGSSSSGGMLHHGNNGSEFNFFPSLPSFDLLRSSCVEMNCLVASPSSNGKKAREKKTNYRTVAYVIIFLLDE